MTASRAASTQLPFAQTSPENVFYSFTRRGKKKYGLDVADIVAAAEKVLARK